MCIEYIIILPWKENYAITKFASISTNARFETRRPL